MLVVGISGSVAAAVAARSSVAGQSSNVFNTQAADVTASVAVSLARVDDLAVEMRTLVSTNPSMTNTQWSAWFTTLDVTHRYPGVLGLAYVQIVPAAAVPAFEKRLRTDPLIGSGNAPFKIFPPGDRPYYCLLRLGQLGAELGNLPPGLDFCALAGVGWLSKPRDTGQLQVAPVNLGSHPTAQIIAPIYSGGGVPPTVSQRRNEVIGLAGDLFDFDVILKMAVRAHPGLSVQLNRKDYTPSAVSTATANASLRATFGKASGPVVGSVGSLPAPSSLRRTLPLSADGGWTIQISTSSAASSRKALTQGLLVLIMGLTLTALLFALVRVLTRGKQRALAMVERRTSELTTSESRFRSLAAASPMGVLQTDATGKFRYGNERLFQILGAPAEQARDMGWLDVFAPDDRAKLTAMLAECARGGADPVEVKIDGTPEERWVRVSVAALAGASEPGFVASLEDVSNEVAARVRLTAEARHDPLTGLPNRVSFLAALQTALADMPRHRGQVAVLFIDLDRFKQVNDAHGHAVGDQLLIATSRRMRSSLRPGDMLSRLGGDEFAILMHGIEDVSAVTAVVDRLHASVSRPFSLGGLHATVGASVGLVLVDDPTGNPDTILQNADMAMYRAKAGSTRFEVFDDSLRANVVARLETEQALRLALERDELVLHFQPIVELKSGMVAGGEALLRWQHSSRGLLIPQHFLPLAESTGLIVPIGDWVLRRAVEVATSWSALPRRTMSVNVSVQQLTSPTLLPQIEHLLASTGMSPHQLCVEILETHLLDETNLHVLRELKRLGVQVSIDDFGTGYSSLLYLKKLPADIVKIDRALIADVAAQREDRVIVTRVVELAHDLGLKVVAEGIERAEQAEVLRDAGCDFGQGFLWSPAVPATEFAELSATGFSPDGRPLTVEATR